MQDVGECFSEVGSVLWDFGVGANHFPERACCRVQAACNWRGFGCKSCFEGKTDFRTDAGAEILRYMCAEVEISRAMPEHETVNSHKISHLKRYPKWYPYRASGGLLGVFSMKQWVDIMRVLRLKWRRGRDSNPRWALRAHNGFRDRRLKPTRPPLRMFYRILVTKSGCILGKIGAGVKGKRATRPFFADRSGASCHQAPIFLQISQNSFPLKTGTEWLAGTRDILVKWRPMRRSRPSSRRR